jgi:aspartyl-tRNA(Asn)/glutamyl-tRNA(Gln) amidotransferase subunit B
VEPSRELVERMRAEVPEPPGLRLRRLEGEVGFELAEGLVASGRDGLYARLAARGLDPVAAANATMNEIASAGVDPEQVSDELVDVIAKRQSISRETLMAAIAASVAPDFSAKPFLEQTLVSASSELEPLIDDILAANAGQVAAYRSGKEGLLGFFVGQVMKQTQGQADPRVVNELLRKKLSA